MALRLDLRRQLAGRGEHQRRDAAAALGRGPLEFLQHGEEERDGLPGARLCTREDVFARHDVGQHLVLNLGGVGVSLHLVERSERLVAEIQIGERHRRGRVARGWNLGLAGGLGRGGHGPTL